MSLFQTSVVKKYLSELSTELIDKKYNEFQAYFGNAERQENIRNSKEEEYQSGFINALFVNILGYTLNPEPNFNIVLEKKNVDDSKKADGAILKDNEVIAVIELKSTQTTDLSKVETQAFGYKNHNPKCQYIITSNFEKIRIYIQNAIDHLEFDLFNLAREDFALLWLCFFKDNILKDIPLKIKESSVLQEENVTKQLYNDYSKFRNEIFENIVKNNPDFDKLALFKKTQKLLDRFLFIFFAEDRLLLPPNSISEIVKQWNDLKENYDEYFPLYERFKKYFGYLNTGFKGKKYDIFAYNGGLFLPDEILDNIKIDDEVLYQNTVQLSSYDFETEVDVNILGHIFEHSLGEIENVQAEIAGEQVDQQKTKRKKDGIFYTPKYITKYIVENTVGKLCEEKRNEFGIIDEEYAKGRKNRKKDIVRALDDKLTAYRDWLLEITILDPACGSGAFLNQALEFLIQEHKKIDELKAQLLGGSIIFPDIEAKILEKNIYGVDLNEESVEIAKLSLWLRTAQKGRKLTTLSNHIKCGNSLIDDPEIAGEKAFNWQNEFPEVFEKGGFDVVIGNPPYLVVKGGRWIGGFQYDKIAIKYLSENFETASQQINTYILFIELGLKLTKKGGFISQITPNTFLANEYSQSLREFLVENCTVIELYNSGLVFDDASVETAVITYRNEVSINYPTNIKLSHFTENWQINLSEIMSLTDDSKFLIHINEESIELLKKLNEFDKVRKYAKVWRGLTTGNDKKYLSEYKETENHKPLISGSEVERYFLNPNKKYVYYKPELLDRPRDERIFLLEQKLISKFVGSRLAFCFDNNQYYVVNTACSTEIIDQKINPFFMLAVMNSKLINYFFQHVFSDSRSTFPIMKSGNIEALPFKVVELNSQQIFINKAESIINYNKEFYKINTSVISLIQNKLEIPKLSKKIQHWDILDTKSFLKELNKSATKLNLNEEAEWISYFEEQKQKAIELKSEIAKIEKEIDQMVYELYDLTKEEINIVEES
jgi:type I restriction-modification system DNA methylase subunit